MTANLAALFRALEPERQSRVREFRLAALLLLGREYPLTRALPMPSPTPTRSMLP